MDGVLPRVHDNGLHAIYGDDGRSLSFRRVDTGCRSGGARDSGTRYAPPLQEQKPWLRLTS